MKNHYLISFFTSLLLLPAFSFQTSAQQDSTSCLCEFGIPYMTVRYDGPSGEDVLVYATKNQTDFVQRFENVDSASQLFVDKSEFMKGSVKTKTYLMIAGDPSSEVTYHTSCSEDILNQTRGFFTVVAYQDAFGHSCSGDLTVTGIKTDNLCYGDASGTIELEVSGGFPPYIFEWSDRDTSEDRDGLGSGDYKVWVQDATGQEDSALFSIQSPHALTIDADLQYTTCGEEAGGSIGLTTHGGIQPYHYSWSTGDTVAVLTDLEAGEYSVSVTDANGCEQTENYTVEETTALGVSIDPGSCMDGSLNVVVTGGSPPYSYTWSTGESTQNIRVDDSGSYSLTVTDVQGCEASDTIRVETIAYLQAVPSFIEPACSGGGTGSVLIEIDGNMGPFDFEWSNGEITQNLEEVPAGTYTLTVTDQRGESCASSFDFTLSEPTPPSVEATVLDISCAGSGDGQIRIDTIVGNGPFEIEWENGDTEYTRSELEHGSYTVTITDSDGCTNSETYQISEPDPLDVYIIYDFCLDEDLTAVVSGGSEPYQYQWNGEAGSYSFVPDSGGTYQVVVTDRNGCSDSSIVTIEEPVEPLNISARVTHPTCDTPTGTIDLLVTGGESPYQYAWENGDSALMRTGLDPGYYPVTVTDQNQCTKSRTFYLRKTSSISITASITDPDCDGLGGSISLTGSGGIAPYEFTWNTGETTSSISGLDSGKYAVTVVDQGGCEVMEEYALARPDTCSTPAEPTDPSLCCDGKVSWLTLQYLGDEETYVRVYQKLDNQLVFDGLVASGETFTFAGMDKKQTLGPEIMINTAGTSTEIHTSCSQPIGPGLIAGDFKVIAGESRNGGELCPVEADPVTSTELKYDLYPNPSASGHLKMKITDSSKSTTEDLTISIYDLTGMLHSQERCTSVQLVYDLDQMIQDLPAGYYIVRVSNGDHSLSKRILIR